MTIRYTVKPLLSALSSTTGTHVLPELHPLRRRTAETAGVQQNTAEYTLGYVAHFEPRHGIIPLPRCGLGTLDFRPTPGGGEGLPPQARATYYYTVGGDYKLSTHFGARAQFREQFFLAPDFETNYLTIKRTPPPLSLDSAFSRASKPIRGRLAVASLYNRIGGVQSGAPEVFHP